MDPSSYVCIYVLLLSFCRKWQHLLDKSTIHVVGRWVVAAVLLAIYLLRVFYLNAFHIVTYGLGIYLLNLFIGFLSPQVRSYRARLTGLRTI